MSKESYFDEFNRQRHAELALKLKELPDFCYDFFLGIEMRTQVLTRLNYARDFAIFFDFLIKNHNALETQKVIDITLDDLDKVRVRDFERFLSYLTYYSYNGKAYKNGQRAKARKMSSLRSLFGYLYQNDMLKENTASKVAMPKLRHNVITRLNDTEVYQLLDNVELENKFASAHQNSYNLNTRDRDIALLTLFLGTGIRVSECVGLNVDDVNLSDNSFIVTRKGGDKSMLYFSDEVRDALENHLHSRKIRLSKLDIKDEKALFLSLQNKRISIRAVENIVKKLAKTVTPLKNITPHKLRSTYGTALYRQIRDIYAVAEVLGHRDINTTKLHYAATSEDIKRDASTKVVLRDDKNK